MILDKYDEDKAERVLWKAHENEKRSLLIYWHIQIMLLSKTVHMVLPFDCDVWATIFILNRCIQLDQRTN